MRFRPWRWISAVLLLTGMGTALTCALWQDGPPLWWALRGRHFERATIQWNGKKFAFTDSATVAKLENAIRNGQSPLPYPTRCLPDELSNWKNWAVTLYDSSGAPFSVDVGLDGCGIFYVPSLDASYRANPDLIALVNQVLHRPATASPFQP